LNASPDIEGNVSAWRTASHAASTIADMAMTLAVFPLILFCGPSQGDTAYSIAIPIGILCVLPLLSRLFGGKAKALPWFAVGALSRLALAASLYVNLGTTWCTAPFIAGVLASLWAIRLQENALFSGAQATRSVLSNLLGGTLPFLSFFVLLMQFETAQPHLIPGSIALYGSALIMLALERISSRRRTASGVNSRNAQVTIELQKSPPTVAYEIVLSVVAGTTIIIPSLLLLTDQSKMMPVLRSDVMMTLTGAATGYFIAAIVFRYEKLSRLFRLEYLHLTFTLSLAALLLCKFTTPALVLLFCTSASAASVSCAIGKARKRNGTWSAALTATLIVGATFAAYLYLSPLQGSWLPIHVIRSLCAITLLVSMTSALTWSRSRFALFQMVAHLVPVNGYDNSLTATLIRGWRARAAIVLVCSEYNDIVRAVLKLGNVYALTEREWLHPHNEMRRLFLRGESVIAFEAYRDDEVISQVVLDRDETRLAGTRL